MRIYRRTPSCAVTGSVPHEEHFICPPRGLQAHKVSAFSSFSSSDRHEEALSGNTSRSLLHTALSRAFADGHQEAEQGLKSEPKLLLRKGLFECRKDTTNLELVESLLVTKQGASRPIRCVIYTSSQNTQLNGLHAAS